ncbi:MAG: methionine adenosyltransferase [Methanobacteriota archaeon]
MAARRHLFTSESVTEGHPDKLCDQVSDAILDAILAEDAKGRVAVESLATTGVIMVAGEVTTDCYVDIPKTVRSVVADIGYTKAAYGLEAETCAVLVAINEQSPDIAQGVSQGDHIGAGDQGLMFGYATDETPEFMPIPILLAHRLARRLSEVRKDGTLKFLRPDGKTQVTVAFDDGKPTHLDGVVVAAQHDDDVQTETLRAKIKEQVITPVVKEYVSHGHLPAGFYDAKTQHYINHTGRFVRGGPFGDTGLTGRKIIVDTYGGAAPHGGGAFSGKDPTKVDRSAAYAARWIAKNVVAAGLARRCLIQLAYSIGSLEPVGLFVDTQGTGSLEDEAIETIVRKEFDLSPGGIIKTLDLRRPIYRQTAAYGHFGRNDLKLPWEALDRVDVLKDAAGSRGHGTRRGGR